MGANGALMIFYYHWEDPGFSPRSIILLSTGGIVGKTQSTLKSHPFIDHPGRGGALEWDSGCLSICLVLPFLSL